MHSAARRRLFAPWARFFSDHPAKLSLRVRVLFFFDILIISSLIISLSSPWFQQKWRVANGETLAWTLSLGSAKFEVDCSSDSPEFLNLCQTLYGRLGGDLNYIARSICSIKNKMQDTDMQSLLQETCIEIKNIKDLSIATGILCSLCLFFFCFAVVVFFLHVGSGYRNRRAWRGSFCCRCFAFLALIISCILYTIAMLKVENLFHVQPSSFGVFDPAQAEPVEQKLLYGFIIAIATAGVLVFYLLFWWHAAPFDPDPYFMEPEYLRQTFKT